MNSNWSHFIIVHYGDNRLKLLVLFMLKSIHQMSTVSKSVIVSSVNCVILPNYSCHYCCVIGPIGKSPVLVCKMLPLPSWSDRCKGFYFVLFLFFPNAQCYQSHVECWLNWKTIIHVNQRTNKYFFQYVELTSLWTYFPCMSICGQFSPLLQTKMR